MKNGLLFPFLFFSFHFFTSLCFTFSPFSFLIFRLSPTFFLCLFPFSRSPSGFCFCFCGWCFFSGGGGKLSPQSSTAWLHHATTNPSECVMNFEFKAVTLPFRHNFIVGLISSERSMSNDWQLKISEHIQTSLAPKAWIHLKRWGQ